MTLTIRPKAALTPLPSIFSMAFCKLSDVAYAIISPIKSIAKVIFNYISNLFDITSSIGFKQMVSANSYLENALIVMNQYEETAGGIVIRMLGGCQANDITHLTVYPPDLFLTHEFGLGFSRGSAPLSATLLVKDIPIILPVVAKGDFGLIYNPDKLYITKAISSSTGVSRRQNFAANGRINSALSTNLSCLNEERKALGRGSLMIYPELTIQPNTEEKKQDAIIGIIVRPEFEQETAKLKEIYQLICKQKPNLPVFAYDSGAIRLVPKPI